MPDSVVKLADILLGADAATIDTGPGANWDVGVLSPYAHLLIEWYARGDTAAKTIGTFLRFNGDAGANYDYICNRVTNGAAAVLQAAGSTNGIYAGEMPAATAPANEFGGGRITVPQYAQTVNHKAAELQSTARAGATNADTWAITGGGIWFATPAAITQITFRPNAGNFKAGSRLTVYALP